MEDWELEQKEREKRILDLMTKGLASLDEKMMRELLVDAVVRVVKDYDLNRLFDAALKPEAEKALRAYVETDEFKAQMRKRVEEQAISYLQRAKFESNRY